MFAHIVHATSPAVLRRHTLVKLLLLLLLLVETTVALLGAGSLIFVLSVARCTLFLLGLIGILFLVLIVFLCLMI